MPLASLRAERALARSEKNQNLPVNSLPPEVLQVVFSEEAEYYWRYYARLFRLRNVCKYWMELIDSTPELWRLISSVHHPEFHVMILRTSKTQTLLVEYNERFVENHPSSKEKMEAFASLTRPTASRWYKLDYNPALDSKSAAWILSLSFHDLHDLEIDGETWTRYDRRMDAPGLHTLRVTRAYLNWLSLSGLTFLKLDETGITLDDLVVVLSASPNLSYLSLVETSSGLGAEDAQNSSPNKILLPRLNHLDAYQLFAGSLSLLLDRIEAPSLGYFSIEGGYTVDEEPEDYTRLFEMAGRYIGAFPIPKGETQDQFFITVEDHAIHLAIGARSIAVWNHSWTTSGKRVSSAYIAPYRPETPETPRIFGIH